MKKSGLAVLIILAALICRARLGETSAQVYNRYGAVQSRQEMGTNQWAAQYTFKEYNVKVLYQNDKSVCEAVWPMESRALSDDERKTLMTSIAGGGTWEEDSARTGLMSTTWTNKVNAAMAFERSDAQGSSQLMVCTHEFELQLAAQRKEEVKDKADGF